MTHIDEFQHTLDFHEKLLAVIEARMKDDNFSKVEYRITSLLKALKENIEYAKECFDRHEKSGEPHFLYAFFDEGGTKLRWTSTKME